MDLTYRQRLFVDAYLGKAGGNATKAAISAGYSDPAVAGHRLLRNAKIRAAVDGQLKAAMSADEVLARLSEHASSDMRDYLQINDDGTFQIDLSKAKRAKRTRVIRKVKVSTKTFTTDTGESVEVKSELELYDAQAALEKLAKFHRLYETKPKIDDAGDKPQIIIPGLTDVMPGVQSAPGGRKAKGRPKNRKST